VNGAAARLIHPGDRVIIITYGIYNESELANHTSKVLVLNERNEVIEELS
jgi:aspartate 1-decarboxylase